MGLGMRLLRTIVWIMATMSLLTIVLFASDYCSRYVNWRNLSAELLNEKISWYLENRAGDQASISAACLYIVACEDDIARLVIAEDIESIDFELLRSRIWDRRFSGICEGRTSNLGLHIIRNSTATTSAYSTSDHAIWSFYNNKFIPKQGRFSGGAFSEEPWERCSVQRSIYPDTE